MIALRRILGAGIAGERSAAVQDTQSFFHHLLMQLSSHSRFLRQMAPGAYLSARTELLRAMTAMESLESFMLRSLMDFVGSLAGIEA